MDTPAYDFTLHVSTDRKGNPLFAWISAANWDDCQEHWVSDREFGPFDTMLDCHVMLSKAVRETAGLRPA